VYLSSWQPLSNCGMSLIISNFCKSYWKHEVRRKRKKKKKSQVMNCSDTRQAGWKKRRKCWESCWHKILGVTHYRFQCVCPTQPRGKGWPSPPAAGLTPFPAAWHPVLHPCFPGPSWQISSERAKTQKILRRGTNWGFFWPKRFLVQGRLGRMGSVSAAAWY